MDTKKKKKKNPHRVRPLQQPLTASWGEREEKNEKKKKKNEKNNGR